MDTIKTEDIKAIKEVLKTLSTNETMDVFVEIMSFIAHKTFMKLSYNMDENVGVLNAAIFHTAWRHPHITDKMMRSMMDQILTDKESIDMCNEFIKFLS